jgi:hypothetical protein
VRGLDRADRPVVTRSVVLSLVAVLVTLGAVGTSTRRDLGRASRELGDELLAAAPPSALGPDDRDHRPVILSAEYLVPQIVWPRWDEARWLHLDADEPVALEGITAAGVDRFTIATPSMARIEPILPEVEVLSREEVHGWLLLVVRPSR